MEGRIGVTVEGWSTKFFQMKWPNGADGSEAGRGHNILSFTHTKEIPNSQMGRFMTR
jgi:hypothetical protein